jgi:hypothetical protein
MARTKYLQAEGESPRPPASSRRSGRSALALPTSPRSDTASGKALESLRHTSSIGLRGGQYDEAANGGAALSLPTLSLVLARPGLVEGRVAGPRTTGFLALSGFPRQRPPGRTRPPRSKALDRYEDVREGLTAVIRLINDLGLEPTAAVEALPEIDEQNVNLVTWLALVSGHILI